MRNSLVIVAQFVQRLSGFVLQFGYHTLPGFFDAYLAHNPFLSVTNLTATNGKRLYVSNQLITLVQLADGWSMGHCIMTSNKQER